MKKLMKFKIAAVNESARELVQFQKMLQKTQYKDLIFVPFQFVAGSLSSLIEFKPDIVFVDNDLGVLSAGAFTEQTSPFLPHSDFILTGVATEDEIVEALRAGAVDYLKKDDLSTAILDECLKRIIKRKIAQRELSKTELKFRTIFDKALDAILIVDYRTELILQANEACEQILGYKSYQLQGEPFSKLFPTSPRTACSKILSEIRIHGAAVEGQPFLRADSTTCHMDVTATIMPYGEDKVIAMTLRDVTSRRAAEEEGDRTRINLEKRVRDRTSQVERSNRKLRMEIFERKRMEGYLLQSRTRLEAAEKIGRMGHWESDPEMLKIHLSPQFIRLFTMANGSQMPYEFSLRDYVGEEVFKILLEKVSQVVKQGETQNMEYWMDLNDGRRVCHYVTIDALKDSAGQVKSILGVIQEITEQKKIAENLQIALERERKLNQMNKVFVSMVSHELRTPLAVIQSAVDLLKDSIPDKGDGGQCLDSIESSLDRMTAIMEKILFLGKVESQQIQFNPVRINFTQLCGRVKNELEAAGYGKKRIQMEFEDVPPLLPMDELFMSHAIQNLLSNGLKYSDGNKKVRLKAWMKGNALQIVISDSGIGIPDDEQHKLFEIFHRCKNASRTTGSGVGMVVVKKCVEAHGGMISFESKEGVGTVFHLSFPFFKCEMVQKENILN